MINSTGDQDDYGWGFFAAYNPGNKTYNQVEDEIAKVAAHMGTFFIFDLADKNKRKTMTLMYSLAYLMKTQFQLVNIQEVWQTETATSLTGITLLMLIMTQGL